MQATSYLSPSRRRPALLAVLFCVELIALALTYQFFADIQCSLTGSEATCDFLSSLVARALVIFAVAGILIRRARRLHTLLEAAELPRGAALRCIWRDGVAAGAPGLMPGRDWGRCFKFVGPWGLGRCRRHRGAAWLAPTGLRDLRPEPLAPLAICWRRRWCGYGRARATQLGMAGADHRDLHAVDGCCGCFDHRTVIAPDYSSASRVFRNIAQQCSGWEGSRWSRLRALRGDLRQEIRRDFSRFAALGIIPEDTEHHPHAA